MLLVTKGAEPKSTAEAFELFIDKFINEGLVDESFKDLVKTAQSNPDSDFSTRKEEIVALADAVIELYEGMDDSLQFKVSSTKQLETNQENPVQEIKTIGIDIRVKDFRGVACPMNFVKTKIELATLKSGELLEIWLDDGQPIQNVPGSVRNEGHEVISAIPEGVFWKVMIKKK